MNLTCGLWVGAPGRGWKRPFAVALATLAACSGMPSDPDAGAGVDMADLAMAGIDVGGDFALPAGCQNQLHDGDESDVDCGGACTPCAVGKMCKRGADCESRACGNGKCVAPSCSDDLLNGAETDVDCGGACSPCAVGKTCLMASDCVSSNCLNNVCKPSLCGNAMKDGDETDVDCGGTTCGKCEDGKACALGDDCKSGNCFNNLCKPAATCGDGQKNGQETDADCGGPTCGKCADGKKCLANGDCTGGLCTAGVCKTPAPGCMDGMKNGPETDLDCGGGCLPCAVGKMCKQGSDCVSGVCSNNVCTAPACNDGVKNGAETDLDCGGAMCGKCADGKVCQQASDCKSGLCTANLCKPGPSCVDGVKNGQESDVDCGGAMCGKCADGKTCTQGSDCASAMCTNGKCAAAPGLTLSFSPPLFTALPDVCYEMAAADLTGDGKMDVAIACSNKGNAEVLIGDGAGAFKRGSAIVTNTMYPINWIGTGDFTGDGRPDVILPLSPFLVKVFPNAGNGMFGAPTVFDHMTWTLRRAAIGDLNADGKLDLVESLGGPNSTNGMGILLGIGDGTFEKPTYTPRSGQVWPLPVVDVTGDGKRDVIAVVSGVGIPGAIETFPGLGDGTFKAPVSTATGSLTSYNALADYNGDGKHDVALRVGMDPDFFYIYTGKGDGNFVFANKFAAEKTTYISAADFNKDGRADVASMNDTTMDVEVFLGKGDSTFHAATAFAPGFPRSGPVMVLADVNADGKMDVLLTQRIIVNGKTNGLTVLLNTSK